MTSPERDAVEVPPWQPAHGPRPRITQWRRRPMLEVRVGGVWRLGIVLARHDYGPGRVAYQVQINLDTDGAASIRTYAWDGAAMRPVDAVERPAS